jgi:hypothetical protein
VTESDYLTPDELVERYRHKIALRTLANWRSQKNGLGPRFLKAGGRILYHIEDVLSWENKRRIGALAIVFVQAFNIDTDWIQALFDYL